MMIFDWLWLKSSPISEIQPMGVPEKPTPNVLCGRVRKSMVQNKVFENPQGKVKIYDPGLP